MRRKVYRTTAVPLGLQFRSVEANVDRMRAQGWTLLSTYVDRNRNTVGQEPTVVGVFETWEKR